MHHTPGLINKLKRKNKARKSATGGKKCITEQLHRHYISAQTAALWRVFCFYFGGEKDRDTDGLYGVVGIADVQLWGDKLRVFIPAA